MFTNITQIKQKNKESGRKFFARKTTKSFSTKVFGKIYHFRYFITREDDHEVNRGYTIREAHENGNITTVGEMGQYTSWRSADAAARKIEPKEDE